MAVNKSLIILACCISFAFCVWTFVQLVLFLSSHSCLQFSHHAFIQKAENSESIWWPLLLDFSLVLVFGLQHSVQKKTAIKEFLSQIGCKVAERLLYNLGSCLALQILMRFWQPVNNWTLWTISTSENSLFWWFFTIAHFTIWLITYGGCFVMDISELFGMRQVYHCTKDWPEPLSLKSEGLVRFYSHMRHPCFSSLSVILFLHPVMQIDRLILACSLTIYMLLFLKVDDVDYAYQKRLLQRKERDLQHME